VILISVQLLSSIMAFMASARKLLLALLSFHVASVRGEMNVYDKPMVDCGADHSSGCTYVAGDGGAHQVCVNQLPHGFSSVTGQGPWSDQFQGQPWCICIWAYSNYILHNKDLPLKCESIPAKVLEEQYSLDKFKQCGQMSSTNGCGPEDIGRSIRSLCQQCHTQATDEDSKDALRHKCDGILVAANSTQRLYESSAAQPAASKFRKEGKGVPEFALFGFVLAFAGLTMLVLWTRGRVNQRNSLLSDDEAQLSEVE